MSHGTGKQQASGEVQRVRCGLLPDGQENGNAPRLWAKALDASPPGLTPSGLRRAKALFCQVLHDVLTRLEKAYQAFFRRTKTGQTPGFPRFQGRHRYHSFTYKQYGNGARLENGFLVLSKIGRMAVRLSRPLAGTPKTVTLSREADGWYACISCAAAPAQPLPPTGRETGIDVGLQVFLITAEGDAVENPRHFRRAEKRLAKAQRRVSRRKKGSHRRRKAVGYLQRAHQTVQRQRRDFQHKAALALLRQYDSSLSKICGSPMWYGTATWPRASAMRAGPRFGPSSKPRQPAPGVGLWRCHPLTPRRTVAAAGRACPRV